MKFKIAITLILAVFVLYIPGFSETPKRPVELQFYVSSYLATSTLIEYNSRGNVIKMSSFENSKLSDYARYRYDSNGRLLHEKTYDSSNILLKTRNYIYDENGLITMEKVYSPSDKLVEYLVISYNSGIIDKIEYYRSDEILYQTIDFNYTEGILTSMTCSKVGSYIMLMKSIYNAEKLLIGHDIRHSNADVKIETKYIYEKGYASDESIQLIFR